ncbi:MAG: WD40 repeat domain-containing protein [Candidatus Poribacteria bacterium]|nr:WD40 repeat domain-containing protein [Candidatus Poribacteria bacterium]
MAGCNVKDPIVGNAELFAFSPDSILLAVKYSARIRLWDLKTKQAYRPTLADQILMIDVLTFSPDAKILLATNWRYDTGSQIQLWDVTAGRKLLTLTSHPKRIETLAFSHDGKTLASGSQDGTVLLWDWDKILEKTGTENIGKVDQNKLKPPGKQVKYTNKAEEAKAVLNWLEKHNYQIKKLGEKVSITQGKSRTLILGSGGGTMRIGDLNFTLSRPGIFQIGVKNVGIAVFIFDEKGDLKYENSNDENQPSQKEIDP